MLTRRVAILGAIVVLGLIVLDARATRWSTGCGSRRSATPASSGRSSPPAVIVFLASLRPSRPVAIWLSGGDVRCAPPAAARPPPAPPPRAGAGGPRSPPSASLSQCAARAVAPARRRGGALLLGLLAAALELANWDMVLRLPPPVPYGERDPVFGQGHRLLSVLAAGLCRAQELAAAGAAVQRGARRRRSTGRMATSISTSGRGSISPAALAHGSALLGLYFAVKAWSYWLDRFLLLYSDNGVVVGAGYTDLHVRLPVLWLLIGLAAAGAVACVGQPALADAGGSCRRARWRCCSAARSCSTRSCRRSSSASTCKPSELALETPYIARNIALTRQAYKLQQIDGEAVPGRGGAEPGRRCEANRATIDNIRLWDWQPLARHLRAAAGDPDLLQVPRHRHRPLPAGRRLPAGDAVGARAGARAAAGQRADLGQPAPALHPRQRRGDVPGDAQDQRRAAGLLSAGHSAGRHRRSRRSASRDIYFGQGRERYVIVKGSTPEFDYPQGQGQRLRYLRWGRRRPDRRSCLAQPVLLVLRRSQHPAHATTSPPRAASCSIATSRSACARSRPCCSSTTIPISS